MCLKPPSTVPIMFAVTLIVGACQSVESTTQPAGHGGESRLAEGSEGSALENSGPVAVIFVKGLSCPLCATAIDKEIYRVAGVVNVRTNFSSGEVRVEHRAGHQPDRATLEQAVKRAGFTVDRVELPAEKE